MVLETKVVLVDGVYCVEFTANHFSPYAFVVDKTGALSEIGSKVDTDTNPKTGEKNNIATVLIIVVLSVATLEVVSKKRQFKVVKK